MQLVLTTDWRSASSYFAYHVTGATLGRVSEASTGQIFSCYAYCFSYYNNEPPFFTCQKGVHNIEKDTLLFGVEQFGRYLTLCI